MATAAASNPSDGEQEYSALERNVNAVVESLKAALSSSRSCPSPIEQDDAVTAIVQRVGRNAALAAQAEVDEAAVDTFADEENCFLDNYEIIYSKNSEQVLEADGAPAQLSQTAQSKTDPEGLGVCAKKALSQYQVVFEDQPVLRHDVEQREFTIEECERWFWHELSGDQMAAVLRLKCSPQAGKRTSPFDEEGGRDEDAAGDKEADSSVSSSDEKNTTEKKGTTRGEAGLQKVSPEALTHLLNLSERGFPTEQEIRAVRDYIRQNDFDHLLDVGNVNVAGAATSSCSSSSLKFRELLLSSPAAIQKLATKMAFGAVRTNSIKEDNFVFLFPLLSRVNHGCEPNLWQQNGVVLALRDIGAGEELFWCYPQGKVLDEWEETAQHFLFLDRDSRQEYLKRLYDFECRCRRCCRTSLVKSTIDAATTTTTTTFPKLPLDTAVLSQKQDVDGEYIITPGRGGGSAGGVPGVTSLAAAKEGDDGAAAAEDARVQENAELLPLRQGFTELTQFVNKITSTPANGGNRGAEDHATSTAPCSEQEVGACATPTSEEEEERHDREWHEAIELLNALENGLEERNLRLDIKLIAQCATLRAVYASAGLLAAVLESSSSSSCSSADLDQRKALSLCIEAVQRELKYHLLGYGAESQAVKDLTRVLGKLYVIQTLRQYVKQAAVRTRVAAEGGLGGA
eukprot:g15973.t1